MTEQVKTITPTSAFATHKSLAPAAMRKLEDGAVNLQVKTTEAVDVLEGTARQAAQRMLELRQAHSHTYAGFGETPVADLQGLSTAYKSAQRKVNEAALAAVEKSLISKGLDRDVAVDVAKRRIETARKSISRYVRILVEDLLTAEELSAYGFRWNRELGESQKLSKPKTGSGGTAGSGKRNQTSEGGPTAGPVETLREGINLLTAVAQSTDPFANLTPDALRNLLADLSTAYKKVMSVGGAHVDITLVTERKSA